MEKIKGVVPPIITPILENEDIDEQSLRGLVNRCVETGLHGIFVAGSGGESMALTQKQRTRAIRIVIEETRGRIPVLCGAMDTSTRRVIENIKEMEQAGAEIAVVTPVFFTKTTDQNDIVRHFEEISRHTQIDIMIYNIPMNTIVNIVPETVEKIARIDKICGLKDSAGIWTQFQKCLFKFRNKAEFSLFQGNTEHAGAGLLCGADGFVPIYGPFFPKVYVKLYESGISGDVRSTMFYQEIANYISEKMTFRGNNIMGAKAAANAFGLGSTKLCEPTVAPGSEDARRLRELVLHIDQVVAGIDTVDSSAGIERLFALDERAANF